MTGTGTAVGYKTSSRSLKYIEIKMSTVIKVIKYNAVTTKLIKNTNILPPFKIIIHSNFLGE